MRNIDYRRATVNHATHLVYCGVLCSCLNFEGISWGLAHRISEDHYLEYFHICFHFVVVGGLGLGSLSLGKDRHLLGFHRGNLGIFFDSAKFH